MPSAKQAPRDSLRTNAAAATRNTRGSPEAEMKRLARLANLLDSSIRLPGGYRIGLDGVIGLIPGIGDAAGAVASFYIVWRAARLGATATDLAKMVVNVLLETVLGAVPLLGDFFDFTWKANNRNVKLLRARLQKLEVI